MYKIFFIFILFVFSLSVCAYEVPEKDWGLAAGFRNAKIPFNTKDQIVQDVIPLMFYDGDTLFIRGLTGGIKLYDKDTWQFSLLGRYRYFDIPPEYQNLVQNGGLDVGGQLKYRFNKNFETNFEMMIDDQSRSHSAIDTRYHWESGSWELFPYATLHFKSADFNNHYYGLDGFVDPDNPSTTIDNKIGSGVDLTVGSEIRYHVISNFYLLGYAQLTTLDSSTRDSDIIKNGTYGEVYLGIAFFNDKTRAKSSSLKAKPYLRLAHGWATPSDLGEILVFDWEDDEQNNQLTSLFYGHPIADSLFGIGAFDIYITMGYIYHHASDPWSQTLQAGQGVNNADFIKDRNLYDSPCDGTSVCTITYDRQPTNEYVLAIKAFYNIEWPVHWRFGLAEGLSYVETATNIEQREMDLKGYSPSKLLNYIDVTADFSLGDTFGVKAMNDLYLGVGIHHRSSIFGMSSALGLSKGGSNFNTIYLQYHW
jgi:outer membrane protein